MLFDEFCDKLNELNEADSPGVRFNDDSEVCFYCGKPLDWANRQWRTRSNAAVIEHVFPKALGGTGHKSNLVWACSECNINKRDKHPISWLIESSLSIPDNIILDIIARVFLAYHKKNRKVDIIYRQKSELLAWAHLVVETLGEEEDR